MLHRPFHDTSTRSANTLFSRGAGKLLHASEFMRSPVGPIFQSAVPRALSPGARAAAIQLLQLIYPRCAIAERTFPYIMRRRRRGGYLLRDIHSRLVYRLSEIRGDVAQW